MATQDYFVLTSAESTEAESYNTPLVEIDPREIDGSNPGEGINLNENASNYELNDPVTLTGARAAPKRIVDDPYYPNDMKTFLLTLPRCSLESETIFAP